jgi:lipooligosaccharide transport system permease protein
MTALGTDGATATARAQAQAKQVLPRLNAVRAMLRHHLQRNRRVWWSTVSVGLMSPTLFLLALGAGLGSQIDDAKLAELGVGSYLDYIGPGVLIVTAMQVSAQDAMWPTMGMIKWGGVYKALLATPISAGELAVGHVAWIGLRALVSASTFLVVLAIAGALGSWWAVTIPLLAMLIGWVHAAPLVAACAKVGEENIFAMINRMVLFPLFLFSGAFFDVDEMPAAVAWAARATPSWHGVEAARSLAIGDVGLVDVGHVAYLVVLSILGFAVARRSFARNLQA